MNEPAETLLSKSALAKRYGVCVRTITAWMTRRILPFYKLSHKVVRFDAAKCDIAIEVFERKSLFDPEIREELARRKTPS
jgi:hypothetical protein